MAATIVTALAVAALCTLLRHRLDHPGRPARELLGGRVRLTALWNRGGAFGIPLKAGALAAGAVGILAALGLWAGRSLWTALGLGGGGARRRGGNLPPGRARGVLGAVPRGQQLLQGAGMVPVL